MFSIRTARLNVTHICQPQVFRGFAHVVLMFTCGLLIFSSLYKSKLVHMSQHLNRFYAGLDPCDLYPDSEDYESGWKIKLNDEAKVPVLSIDNFFSSFDFFRRFELPVELLYSDARGMFMLCWRDLVCILTKCTVQSRNTSSSSSEPNNCKCACWRCVVCVSRYASVYL